jgi:AraC family transcriptional regulator of adaptative response/methylated-DNA-[protein]-cysteine methyltransferase
MMTSQLPPRGEMMAAFHARDAQYDGVFVTAVTSTGVFCRPTCPARRPREENVEFYATARDALLAGFRPCLRCRPLEPDGMSPGWVRELLAAVEEDPLRRWTDADLRHRDLDPDTVRRWFQAHHGMTFHAYHRARRLGLALGQIRNGTDVTSSALDHGYDSLSGFNDAFRQLFGEAPSRAANAVVVVVERLLTPLGPMLAGATEEGLCLLEFGERRMLATQLDRLRRRLGCVMVPGTNPIIEQTAGELRAYFAGSLRVFTVPIIDPGTDFQRLVWAQLRAIPYGGTASYAEIARHIGQPTAVRAVARANGDNRLALVIPCHRVIGSDGSLTGYGGGLWRKKRLLEHERAVRTRGA